MLSPGIVLQQRYRIKRLLAQGGMGAVYEAEAIHLRNAPVAVKETFYNEDRKKLREQFELEAATLARLRHPALPQVKDHFIEGGGQFLVMDFIEGDDLGALLERRLKTKGAPFGFQQVMEWAERLLDALDYIHGQNPPVIHRDIKPQNLKLTPRGELFLIDFGLAKDATTTMRPGHSVHAYTLEFAPPEQINSEGTDARSDLYSLGATLYHLVTGKLPPDARVREEVVVKHLMPDLLKPAHHVNPQVPFAFAAALSKALALDRGQRYQSAQEMREGLRQIKQTFEAESAETREAVTAPIVRPDEAVTRPIVRQPVADELRIEQEKPAREAASAVKRKTLRLAIVAVAAIVLIALPAYLLWKPSTSTNDKTAGANLPRIEMVLVPGGSFLMGSPENESGRSEIEGPQHRVTVSSFYIGKYEVTQAQWYAVMGSNPSGHKGYDSPVENVSWDEAKDFCRRLSQMTGAEYRLPTEAEWEYACRAGTDSAYAGDLDAMAWYDKNSDSKPHPVGRKQPNAFRLYDMHGNVWEWCEDDWHGGYAGAPIDGSAWVDTPSRAPLRVGRGGGWGGWGGYAVRCRSANRGDGAPGYRDGYLGFRLARTYR